MDKISYKLTLGDWSVNSADDPKTELIGLETFEALDGAGGYGRVVVYAPPPPQPGLLEQAVGAAVSAASSTLGLGGEQAAQEEAFGVDVRGERVRLGDQMTVELHVGPTSARVFSAEIQSISSDFGVTTVVGVTGAQKLAATRLNQVYEQQTLRQIVGDLAGQAGVQTGELAQGATYPYVAVHESKTLLRTLHELAAREGLDVYFDADNKLTLKLFEKTKPDHTLYYGIDLLDLEALNLRPPSEHILVYGESPASNQGADSWHWLAKDTGPFRSEIGQGQRRLAIQDGAIRTKDAADAAAKAKLGAIKDRASLGRLKILGRPTLRLGDAIELKNIPKPELNGLFKVIWVRHVFNKRDGYVTYAGFSGQGGAAAAGDLLGQLGGALAGAAGALGL